MEKSDQDLSPNRKLVNFPISPAKDSFRKESRSVPDSQSLREGQGGEDLLELRLGVESPPHSPVKSMQASVSKQYVTSPLKPLPQQSDHQLQKNQSEKCRVSNQRRCGCVSSECLKLYCICFKSGSYCNGTCTCLDCRNKLEYEHRRQKAITKITALSPNAFKPKIVDSPKGDLKGCCCRKTRCNNDFCKCYEAYVLCSDNCRCQNCNNVVDRDVLVQVSETNIQQTTNTPVKRAIDMSGDVNSPESKKRKSKDSSLE